MAKYQGMFFHTRKLDGKKAVVEHASCNHAMNPRMSQAARLLMPEKTRGNILILWSSNALVHILM